LTKTLQQNRFRGKLSISNPFCLYVFVLAAGILMVNLTQKDALKAEILALLLEQRRKKPRHDKQSECQTCT